MTTIAVINSGTGSYTIDNQPSNPTISLIRGNTYNLAINANGHPFWIQTVSGPYSAGNIYNEGVTNNGSQTGTITFVVPYNAPDTLYYACQYHGSMQGMITITGSASPTIGSFSILNQVYSSGGTFTITDPSSNSNGAFSYTSSDTNIARVSGSTVTILQVGTVTITATQAAAGNYTSGTATASLTIGTATPNIGSFSIPNQVYSSGATFTITPPSSNSNGAFSYTSSDTNIARVSGSTVTILQVGTVTITATQAAAGNYTSGTATASLTIGIATPTITNSVAVRSFSMSSSFTNNAQVYYKPNSLSTGGGGSGVKNHRHKLRRT